MNCQFVMGFTPELMDLTPTTVLSLVGFVLHSATCFEGRHQIVGPSQPVVALVGDDIILLCKLKPAMNVLDMTVEWARSDLDPRFIYVWRDGVELESKKHPSYVGRTSLFIDKLKIGDISLKLSKVKITDEGRYRCFIPDFKVEFVIDLVVGAVSSPVILSIDRTTSGVVLECESKGWYPEPELFWLDGDGNLLSAGPTETVQGPDDLYTVSSRVSVEKRHSSNFTCKVQQKNINQTRETNIHISANFFTVQTSSAVCIFFGIILVFVLLCSPAVAFVWWKWRKEREKNNNTKPGIRVSEAKRRRAAWKRETGGSEQLVLH